MHPERQAPPPVAERIAKRLKGVAGVSARNAHAVRDIKDRNIVNFEFVLAA
jgi:hypothetical protein